MSVVRIAPSDIKPRSSSRENIRLWKLPAYGKPLGSAPSHRPWKTPSIRRPRFPQLPQPLPLETQPEPDEESDSPSSTPTLISAGTKTGSTPADLRSLFSPHNVFSGSNLPSDWSEGGSTRREES